MQNPHLNLFRDGVRVLLLIQRSKEGETGNLRKQKKLVSRDAQEFMKCLAELRGMMGENHRIYSTVNARDLGKAIYHFRKNQLDADYQQDQSFYCDIKNRWISCLMKNSSRAETHFLIDCDTVEEYNTTCRELIENKIKRVCEYPTKNGWHIVTGPFNPNLLTHKDKIAKDGLLLIDY